VLELANFVAGPLAGRALADLGATVTKVERPGRGDDGRHFPPHFGDTGVFYVQCNRNKQSIAVDLADADGRAIVANIAAQCDIFLTNFRAGALRRLGLDYDTLHARSPRMVYCSVSGFGAFGDEADRASYDASIQALCGLMRSSGSQEEQPLGIGPSVIDNAAAAWATVGVLAALHERERTGVGRHVDTSLVGTALDIMSTDIMRYRATGVRQQRQRAGSLYRASDNGWIQLAIGNDRVFDRICQVIGKPDLASDERFATAAARALHGAALEPIFTAAFAQRPAKEWESLLVGNEVPAAAARYIDEVLDEPAIVASHLESYVDPRGTEVPQVRTPIDFAEGETQLRIPPPALGADTRQVLQEFLGLDDARIDKLVSSGTVVCPAESGGSELDHAG